MAIADFRSLPSLFKDPGLGYLEPFRQLGGRQQVALRVDRRVTHRPCVFLHSAMTFSFAVANFSCCLRTTRTNSGSTTLLGAFSRLHVQTAAGALGACGSAKRGAVSARSFSRPLGGRNAAMSPDCRCRVKSATNRFFAHCRSSREQDSKNASPPAARAAWSTSNGSLGARAPELPNVAPARSGLTWRRAYSSTFCHSSSARPSCADSMCERISAGVGNHLHVFKVALNAGSSASVGTPSKASAHISATAGAVSFVTAGPLAVRGETITNFVIHSVIKIIRSEFARERVGDATDIVVTLLSCSIGPCLSGCG